MRLCRACALVFVLASKPVWADDSPDRQRNFFVMAGRITSSDMADSLGVVTSGYEKNYVMGGGFQNLTWRSNLVQIGYEVGAVLRKGDRDTTEIWAGILSRFRGLRVSRHMTITPSIIFGLSHVDGIQNGREAELADEYQGDPSLLFYLSPELELSHADRDWSVFWRLHHRSGGGKTLGNMRGATNANAVGLRFRF
ncbi:hypothetical protein PAF17_15755 [Paracoccus sp. Z330]|uniref:Acyloxyacyl hydrolase n=1 Tax=Paracoccus onchidii TaxID=3017813 RepID=A0ABT4ZHW5_9RHOB|nr:hypothetical protein [Paracoccus onchidii]MDB6178948.1 hypothetical protein [Paracoccus onchidii]